MMIVFLEIFPIDNDDGDDYNLLKNLLDNN